MKRFFIVVIVVIMSFFVTSFAEDIYLYECEVESLCCSILCPSNITALYKGMSNSKLKAAGLSKEIVDDLLDSNNLEFVAFNKDDSFELQVSKYDAVMNFRLKDKDDVFLNSFLITFTSSREEYLGVPIISSELYRTNDNVYIRYEWYCGDDDDLDYVITYYTTMDGIVYEFNYFCRESLEDYEAGMAEALINNLTWDFDLIAAEKEGRQSPNLNRYMNPETGISFIIPYGWEEVALNKQRNIIKMKMSPSGMDGVASIMFGYQDAWDLIPITEKIQFGLKTRNDLDSLYMSSEVLAEAYGIDVDDIKPVLYGDHVFYIC